MNATTVDPLPGYPAAYLTEDNHQITIRPMVPGDEEALLDFFRTIPEEDRYYLKEDVIDPGVIQRWAKRLDYSRVLPLLVDPAQSADEEIPTPAPMF
jgi:hypothetical protein